MQNQFDGKSFSLTMVDNVVTFIIDGIGYGWGGVIASSENGAHAPTVARVAFRAPGQPELVDGLEITDAIESELASFFTSNGLDWPSEKATIDGVRAQHATLVSSGETPGMDAGVSGGESGGPASGESSGESSGEASGPISGSTGEGSAAAPTGELSPLENAGLIVQLVAKVKAEFGVAEHWALDEIERAAHAIRALV